MEKSVGMRLSALLARRNMTPHSFAVENNMNVATITRIVSGNSNPKYSTLEKISTCLGVDVGELLSSGEKSDTQMCDNKFLQEVSEKTVDYSDMQKGRILGYIDCINGK